MQNPFQPSPQLTGRRRQWRSRKLRSHSRRDRVAFSEFYSEGKKEGNELSILVVMARRNHHRSKTDDDGLDERCRGFHFRESERGKREGRSRASWWQSWFTGELAGASGGVERAW
ncbi:hypothetical protein V6N12_035665 [Hibiscus sabdariffa]|uniref:Uncharacterized protein n=1 Tax=Hibiscus sabdariffa TaxID=183260 RepID=A0ABR2ENE4_9ROSI